MPMTMGVLTGNSEELLPFLELVDAHSDEDRLFRRRAGEIAITYQDATFLPLIIGSGSFFMKVINA
jgi:hypothetical protein